jgi:putative aldouronate transport system permease protein
MALPVLLFYIVFGYVPLAGLTIAFQDYNIFRGFGGSRWIGFDNFVRFLTGPNILRLIRNTFLINLYFLIFEFPAPVILALMINEVKNGSAKKIVQTISYMPQFISLVVICGMINDFCRSRGIFNSIAALFGIERINLLGRPELFRFIYVSTSIWQTMGWGSIIYIATLSTVSPDMYDAAELDGAGRMRRIIHVSIPALFPVIVVQLIMRIGNIMSLGFEKIILLYNPLTYETADVISTYVYRAGLLNSNYSFGTAVGIFNSVVNIAVLVSVNAVFRRFTGESLW